MILFGLLTKHASLIFYESLALILFSAELTAQELAEEERKANRKARKQE